MEKLASNVIPYNEETREVMDTINGNLSQKTIIQNFFGLRDCIVFAED